MTRLLEGKKIAVLVETEFIPEEIEAYQTRFPELGATVHLMSRLWENKSARFVSDVDTVGKSLQYLDVNIDFQDKDINDYAAVIMSACYTSVRLRYFEPPVGQPISPAQMRTAPAVRRSSPRPPRARSRIPRGPSRYDPAPRKAAASRGCAGCLPRSGRSAGRRGG